MSEQPIRFDAKRMAIVYSVVAARCPAFLPAFKACVEAGQCMVPVDPRKLNPVAPDLDCPLGTIDACLDIGQIDELDGTDEENAFLWWLKVRFRMEPFIRGGVLEGPIDTPLDRFLRGDW